MIDKLDHVAQGQFLFILKVKVVPVSFS